MSTDNISSQQSEGEDSEAQEKLETRDPDESQIEEKPEELPEHEENPGMQVLEEDGEEE